MQKLGGKGACVMRKRDKFSIHKKSYMSYFGMCLFTDKVWLMQGVTRDFRYLMKRCCHRPRAIWESFHLSHIHNPGLFSLKQIKTSLKTVAKLWIIKNTVINMRYHFKEEKNENFRTSKPGRNFEWLIKRSHPTSISLY